MENQHRKITGYRELNQSEIDLMNLIKEEGRTLEEMVTALEVYEGADKRWLAIGRTHLQEGLMALTRAIAKPNTF